MKRLDPGRALPALVVMILLSACGGSPAATAAPTTASPDASLPPAAVAPTPGSPATATPAPTQAIVLRGTWVRPRADARVTSYRTTLSARPSAAGEGVTTFAKVVFSAAREGAKKVTACTAKEPGADDTWACVADLLALGIPPGTVTFTFDVHAVGVTTARAPDGPRTVTYAVPPPKPADARWKDLGARRTGRYEVVRTYRVSWSSPAGYATQFLVYNTWDCPRDSSPKNVGTPCFVAGTPVDVSKLELLGKAKGDAGSVKVHLHESECGPSYGSVLVRARNAFGDSAFTIIEVATVPDPRDMVC